MRKITFILILIKTVTVLAQSTANYFFSTVTTGSLIDMSSGTTSLIGALQDEAVSSLVDIGFDFVFMGKVYSKFAASSNGFIRLGVAPSSALYENQLSRTDNLPIIAPFWDNLATSATGGVRYKVIGTAPNRVLVVEWYNMEVNYSSSTADATFQLLLKETSGEIEFIYGSMNIGSGSSIVSASIGFTNGNTDNSLIYITSLNTPAVGRTASGVQNGLVSSNTPGPINGLHSTSDGNRRVFVFTPPSSAPTAPTNLSFSSIGASVMTLNWTDNATDETGYVIYRSTDGTNYTLITTTPLAANKNLYSVIGLNPSTLYYWRIYAVNEGRLSDFLSGSQSTNAPLPLSGIKTISPTGNFTSLSVAVSEAMSQGLSGPTIFEFQSDYNSENETYPITINAIPGASFTNTLTIRPASGVSDISITGSHNSALIILNGADYIVFDGRPGGSGSDREINISNTATTHNSGVFMLVNYGEGQGATNNIIRNCNISTGTSSLGTFGIYIYIYRRSRGFSWSRL